MATYTRRINLYINGTQVRNDIKSINAEMIKLQRITNTATIGSKEYNEAMRRIRMLKPILDEHNAQLRKTSVNLLSIKGLANAYNKFMPMLMGTIGTFAGVAFGTSKAAQAFGEFDDKVADVMKVTKMSRDQVVALNKELKKIDTRTAQNTLLELAWVAGKLGITAQEDILGFVRAADQITVALAKDLGGNAEEAIRAIGKAVNIFRLEEVYGIEDAMLRVGSAINELGMASVAQEGFLVKFLERVAGIAPLAGVTIENVLGLAATLDMFGQKSEVSATAYSKMMTKMATETETMARITGMSIKEWTQLFTEDANEAMLVLLESLGGEGTAVFNELVSLLGDAGLEGQRMTQVMGALANNVKTIRQQQELANKAFAEGTSVTNEFNIKNNNAQAIIEKKQKALQILRVELGDKLLPVYISGMGILERFLKGMIAVVDFIYNKRKVISELIIVLIAYQVAMHGINLANTFYMGSMRTLKGVITMVKLAYFLLTGQIAKAEIAQKALNKTMFKNPWGALTAALATATYALIRLTRAKEKLTETQKAVAEINKETNAQIGEETIKLKMLYDQLMKTNPGSERRKKLIEEINEIHPDLVKNNDLERASVEQLKKIYDDYIVSLTETIETKLQLEKAEQIVRRLAEIREEKETANIRKRKKLIEEETQLNIALFDLKEELLRKDDTRRWGSEAAKVLEEIRAINRALKTVEEGFISIGPAEGSDKGFWFKDEWIDQNDEIRITQLRNKLEELWATFDALRDAADQAGAATSRVGGAPGSPDYSDEAEKRALLELERQYLKDKETITQRGLAKITDTEELYRGIRFKNEQEYNERVLRTQIRFAQGRLSVADKDGESYLKMQTDLSGKLLKQAEAEHKKMQELQKSGLQSTPFEQARQEYIQALIDRDLFFKKTEDFTQLHHDALVAETDKYLAKIDKLNAEHFKEQFKMQDDAFDLQITQMKFEHAQELRNIETIEQAKNALRKYLSEQEVAQYSDVYEAKKRLQKEQEAVIAARQIEYTEGMLSQIKQILESAEFDYFDTDMAEAFLSDQSKDALISRFKEIMAEFIKLVNGIKEGADVIDEKFMRLRGTNLDIFGFSQDDWERFFLNLKQVQALNERIKEQRELGLDVSELEKLKNEETMNLALMGAMAIANTWSDINRIVANMENRRLQEYQKSNERQHEILQERLRAGIISEESYNYHRQRLDADLERKQAEIARRQAVRDKSVALFSAIINTAVAVTKVLHNPVLAKIIAAAGALQIGIIASQPMPQIPGAETGGQIDVVRAQDGKQFSATYQPGKRGFVHKPTVITGENGSEYIIPEEGVKNPYLQPIIQQMENARKTGNLATLNPAAIQSITMPGRQRGGYLQQPQTTINNNSTNVTYPVDDIKEIMQKSNKIMTELKKELERGIVAHVALTGRKGLIESEQEYQRLLNNANL